MGDRSPDPFAGMLLNYQLDGEGEHFQMPVEAAVPIGELVDRLAKQHGRKELRRLFVQWKGQEYELPRTHQMGDIVFPEGLYQLRPDPVKDKDKPKDKDKSEDHGEVKKAKPAKAAAPAAAKPSPKVKPAAKVPAKAAADKPKVQVEKPAKKEPKAKDEKPVVKSPRDAKSPRAVAPRSPRAATPKSPRGAHSPAAKPGAKVAAAKPGAAPAKAPAGKAPAKKGGASAFSHVSTIADMLRGEATVKVARAPLLSIKAIDGSTFSVEDSANNPAQVVYSTDTELKVGDLLLVTRWTIQDGTIHVEEANVERKVE